jgi:hypothetical protein
LPSPKKESTRADLFDTAFDVARRYEEFGSYGSVRKAERALARRCPGHDVDQYPAAFRSARALWAAASKLVDLHAARLVAIASETHSWDFPEFDAELRRDHPGFEVATLRGAISWCLYWHHLR